MKDMKKFTKAKQTRCQAYTCCNLREIEENKERERWMTRGRLGADPRSPNEIATRENVLLLLGAFSGLKKKPEHRKKRMERGQERKSGRSVT